MGTFAMRRLICKLCPISKWPISLKSITFLVLTLLLLLIHPSYSLETVNTVDFQKYAGDWYEIAYIPYFFEKKCVQNSKVKYTPIEASVYIDHFECEQRNGKLFTFQGRAKIIDVQTNAKLSATFLNLLGWRYWFGDNYWILDLDKNYTYSVIGEPSLNYAWILSRTPLLSTSVLRDISHTLSRQGYNPCKLVTVPQEKGEHSRTSICNLLNQTPELTPSAL